MTLMMVTSSKRYLNERKVKSHSHIVQGGEKMSEYKYWCSFGGRWRGGKKRNGAVVGGVLQRGAAAAARNNDGFIHQPWSHLTSNQSRRTSPQATDFYKLEPRHDGGGGGHVRAAPLSSATVEEEEEKHELNSAVTVEIVRTKHHTQGGAVFYDNNTVDVSEYCTGCKNISLFFRIPGCGPAHTGLYICH